MIRDGINLVLRPYEPDEWPLLSQWFYSGKYADFFRDQANAMTIDQFRLYAAMPNGQAFVVRLKYSGEAIGLVVYFDHKIHARTAKMGILIDEAHQGKGYCREATWLMCNYLFNGLGLRKLIMETMKRNRRVARVSEYGGFQLEATLKEEAFVGGEIVDIERYFITDNVAKRQIKWYEEVLWVDQQLRSQQLQQPLPQQEQQQQQPQDSQVRRELEECRH